MRGILEEEGTKANVRLVAVDTDDSAWRLRFPGGPTIRVDGGDLFPSGLTDRVAWALGCRMYRTPEVPKGAPTPEMLRSALHAVLGSAGEDRGVSGV